MSTEFDNYGETVASQKLHIELAHAAAASGFSNFTK